jgi:hypothetical protein
MEKSAKETEQQSRQWKWESSWRLKQDGQCRYNVTLRCMCATIVAVAIQGVLTYSECVFVALGIQYAMHMHYVFICGLLSSTVFFHIIV